MNGGGWLQLHQLLIGLNGVPKKCFTFVQLNCRSLVTLNINPDSLMYLTHGWANLPIPPSWESIPALDDWQTEDILEMSDLSTTVINYSLIKIVNLQYSNNNPILSGVYFDHLYLLRFNTCVLCYILHLSEHTIFSVAKATLEIALSVH